MVKNLVILLVINFISYLLNHLIVKSNFFNLITNSNYYYKILLKFFLFKMCFN